jgi:hypothetical protein
MDFSTFVCMMCSGLHREINHKVKGISMSEFTEAEVAALTAGGNAVRCLRSCPIPLLRKQRSQPSDST